MPWPRRGGGVPRLAARRDSGSVIPGPAPAMAAPATPDWLHTEPIPPPAPLEPPAPPTVPVERVPLVAVPASPMAGQPPRRRSQPSRPGREPPAPPVAAIPVEPPAPPVAATPPPAAEPPAPGGHGYGGPGRAAPDRRVESVARSVLPPGLMSAPARCSVRYGPGAVGPARGARRRRSGPPRRVDNRGSAPLWSKWPRRWAGGRANAWAAAFSKGKDEGNPAPRR